MDSARYVGTVTEIPPKIPGNYLVLSALEPSYRVENNRVSANSTLLCIP